MEEVDKLIEKYAKKTKKIIHIAIIFVWQANGDRVRQERIVQYLRKRKSDVRYRTKRELRV